MDVMDPAAITLFKFILTAPPKHREGVPARPPSKVVCRVLRQTTKRGDVYGISVMALEGGDFYPDNSIDQYSPLPSIVSRRAASRYGSANPTAYTML